MHFALRTPVIGAALLVAATAAVAQDKWPSNRITLVVPFAAGSITDGATRLLADRLKTHFPQPFIVENRAGAGATLGSRAVARAAPDGYTLLIGGNSTHSAAPSLFKVVPYDPIGDFTPIARIIKLGSVFATNRQQPFQTIEAAVAHARTNPGKLTYGHGNAGGQIVGETLKKRLDLNIVRLPYSSTPPAVTDLLANNIQLMLVDSLAGIPLVETGKLVPLAVPATERYPRLPNIPTLGETVVPGFSMVPWFGMFGPPGLPTPVVEQLSMALSKIMAERDLAERLIAMGLEPFFLASAPFTAFVKADIPVWTEHARTAGIEPQ